MVPDVGPPLALSESVARYCAPAVVDGDAAEWQADAWLFQLLL
jgi:hypothetical protein